MTISTTRKLSLAVAAAAGFLASAPIDASALPMSYFFRGIGSGILGTASFSDAAFEIEVQTDTDTIELQGPFVATVPDITTIVTIAGLGSAIYGDGFGAFVNREDQPGEGPQVGFGEFQAGDRLDVGNAAFGTYTLDQEIGPIPVALTFLGQFPPGGDPTSGGAFLLRTATELTFEARLTDVSDVVEPTTTAAFAAGLAALGFARRRKA